jgi:hypothetical protein
MYITGVDEAAKVLHGCSEDVVKAHLKTLLNNTFVKWSRIQAFHGRALTQCMLEDIIYQQRDRDAVPISESGEIGPAATTAWEQWSYPFTQFVRTKYFLPCVQKVWVLTVGCKEKNCNSWSSLKFGSVLLPEQSVPRHPGRPVFLIEQRLLTCPVQEIPARSGRSYDS